MPTSRRSTSTSRPQQKSSNPTKSEPCWSEERQSQISLLLEQMNNISTKDTTDNENHISEDEVMTPDKRLAKWMENINRTLCEDSRNGKRNKHPYSKYVAEDCVFNIYHNSSTMTKDEQYAMIKSDTEENPGWRPILHDCKANVNIKAGYADVYMCMSVEGRIPGVLMQCFCVAEWRKRVDGWFQTAFSTYRSPPGFTGETGIVEEKESGRNDCERRVPSAMNSAWLALLDESKKERRS